MHVLWLVLLVSLQLFSNTVEFTEQEKLWMHKNKTITYVGDPKWLPFEAFDDKGNYIGIVARFTKTHRKNNSSKI